MVGVMLGFEIDHQWPISIHAQSGSSKGCAFETVRGVFVQNTSWAPGSIREMVGLIVEKPLDTVRIFQAK
jgi:hypothetical protein